jgi:hypothetical protein
MPDTKFLASLTEGGKSVNDPSIVFVESIEFIESIGSVESLKNYLNFEYEPNKRNKPNKRNRSHRRSFLPCRGILEVLQLSRPERNHS